MTKAERRKIVEAAEDVAMRLAMGGDVSP